MIEALIKAIQFFGHLNFLVSMFAGVITGLVFGFIPGVGMIVALTLFLPLVFVLTPDEALTFMIAADAVGFMGGSISAILLNIPGTAPNAATMLDGFPMTQKGQGGRALGAALTSSATGSLLSTFFALALIPLILPIVYALTSAEMVFIILMGLSFIVVLGKGSMIKGLVSGGLGLLASFIGLQIVSGAPRFTFGSVYLYDGLSLVPVALGLFAVPEMLKLSAKGGTLAPQTGTSIKGMKGVWDGFRDVYRNFGLCLRTSLIGFIVGLIPGIGATVATFVSYGYAKQTSKHPEKFGTGAVEGVIAPESANDSKEAGSLLTTLSLGIPGSSSGAIVLGAFLILGITPGPEMLTKHLDLSLSLMLVIIVASVIGAIICFPLAPYAARVANINSHILAPLVIVVIFIGSFVSRQEIADLVVLIVFIALGFGMKRYGYNRPAFFLAYLLGVRFELYLFLALGVSGTLFFLRPISLGIIFLTIGVFALTPMKKLFQRLFNRKVKTR
jgi:TctA family transporter